MLSVSGMCFCWLQAAAVLHQHVWICHCLPNRLCIHCQLSLVCPAGSNPLAGPPGKTPPGKIPADKKTPLQTPQERLAGPYLPIASVCWSQLCTCTSGTFASTTVAADFMS